MPPPETPLTLLDASAVVNLYATRCMGPIIAAVEGPVAIVDIVAREAQFVLRGGDGDDARDREPVDLQPFLPDGLLAVISTDVEEELLTYIDLAAEIDEGEAMTAAVAIHRGCIVVTDDRKASRVMTAHGELLRSSLDLIRVWSEKAIPTAEILRGALIDLRQRGNYEPARRHALRVWWEDVLELPQQ